MRYFVKKETANKCAEPCPFLNEGRSEEEQMFSGVRIGSGFCQKSCEHLKSSNLIENHGEGYEVHIYGAGLKWIECDKLNEQ